MGDLVVGLDVGTHKICTIVGEVRPEDIYVVGLGIETSDGMKKGVVSDVGALSVAIAQSIRKAEKSSGYDINRAFVSVAGSHISSLTSRGMATVVGSRSVQTVDLEKAMSVARNIAIPHNREILHVVPRSYTLDGQEGIRSPLGMHCFRLEVDAHIITASTTSLANLEDAVESAGLLVDRFILNPLAAGEAVLTPHEREMGAVVIDIGGGTTDIAIFIDNTVWHTAIIPVGGNHVTQDITYWMRVPFGLAEQVKIQRGHADMQAVSESEVFPVEPFGGEILPVSRRDLAMVIEARFEEIFEMVEKEIKRSGYAGLLRAGSVITGGSSLLPGYRDLASRILNLPVRLAQPERVTGIADTLKNPSYSTSVGLLRLGLEMDAMLEPDQDVNVGVPVNQWTRRMNNFLKRFLPQDE
ncbi:MAG: cell division protein FtsA [Chloroflexi bacterium]|nr:cell division protein FtsA [Chloroflexota bacterium]MCY3582229.1 cell division protein FtsA [Chloroflexota bacterium]MCY3715031.1 cell division protein FtsA [Chloroflexota bacterium]MDE2650557.1 cell division protein FtsA [Chloroflexota bacterium]MXX49623.1 cell division protein FtsA [Chloroflexota bacterium]